MNFIKNRKGFTGIETVVIIAILGAVTYFAAPKVGKGIHDIFEGTKNRQKARYKVTEQYTMFYKDSKGNFVPAKVPYKRTEESLNYISAEPQKTLWEKFWEMGIMAVVVIIVLSYLGLWPVIRLFWNKKIKPKIDIAETNLRNIQYEKDVLSHDARLIVNGIDEGLTKFDTAIMSAKTAVKLSQDNITNASSITEATARQTAISQAQATQATAQVVMNTLSDLKEDFLAAMSRKQNNTTKLLVRELKND